MELNTITAGIIGIISTFSASFGTWLFTRKKTNSEVNTNEIENLRQTVAVYMTMVHNLDDRIQLYHKDSVRNVTETIKLREEVYQLLPLACNNHLCKKRIRYNKETLHTDNNKNIEDGSNKEIHKKTIHRATS